MMIKRICAVAFAVLCAALIFTNGEKDSKPEKSTSVKIQYSYMLSSIKTNIENDPSSPFSVYAENELGKDECDVARLYSDITPRPSDIISAVPGADTGKAAGIVCKMNGRRFASSSDGSVWLYADNYFVGCDSYGVSLVLRSPAGMIKGAPKDAPLCLHNDDRMIGEVSSHDDHEDIIVSVGRAGRAAAFCVVDKTLSSPLLYDFSYYRGGQN